MPGLPASRQLDEISGQQDRLGKEYGSTPYIFRSPGGNYEATTIDSVSKAGLKGLMLWKEAMQIADMEYQTSAHLCLPIISSVQLRRHDRTREDSATTPTEVRRGMRLAGAGWNGSLRCACPR
jgi:peptidoglycan/xylan/chitin deacetylase (PgdA/CDA1 family)